MEGGERRSSFVVLSFVVLSRARPSKEEKAQPDVVGTSKPG